MIDGRFWDRLEQLGRLIRSSNKPFGGIQLVLYVLPRPSCLSLNANIIVPSTADVATFSNFRPYQTDTIAPRSLRFKRKHGTSVSQRCLR